MEKLYLVNTIVTIATTIVFVMTLYASIASYRSIAIHSLRDLLISRAVLLLKSLGIEVTKKRIEKLKDFVCSGYALGIALTVLLFIASITNRVIYAIPLSILLISIAVSTISLKRVSVSVVKRVYVEGIFKRIEIEFVLSRSAMGRVCDGLDRESAVVEDSPCLEGVFVGGKVYRYSYGVLSKGITDRVIVELSYPLAISRIIYAVSPRIEVIYREVEGLRKVASSTFAETTEPSIDGVKPYSYGDELKRVVFKSIAYPGGLRTKVLEKSRDAIYGVEGTPSADLYLGDYICRYYVGKLQLFNLLEKLRVDGLEQVYVGLQRIGVDKALSIGIDVLCSWYSSTILKRSSIAIVSPDRVSIDILEAYSDGIIVILYPIVDRAIDSAILSSKAREWIESLRRCVDEFIELARSRGIDVVVFFYG